LAREQGITTVRKELSRIPTNKSFRTFPLVLVHLLSARTALGSIVALRPDKAVLAETGVAVAVEEVELGTRIAVKPGDRVPLDGMVVSGHSALDESNLTGESRPVSKGKRNEKEIILRTSPFCSFFI